MPVITLSYKDIFGTGLYSRGAGVSDGIWIRFRNAARELDSRASINSHHVELSWAAALSLLRTFASLQNELGFDFDTDESSNERVQQFIRDYKEVRNNTGVVSAELTESEIQSRLKALGWKIDEHGLKPYQLSNLRLLLSLRNGANFSVPGAGKTTVTFALHLLARHLVEKLIVIAPRNAFPAWETVIEECLLSSADSTLREAFTSLTGGEAKIVELLDSRANRFIISYDQLVRVDAIIEKFLATHKVHLILDESHRMKAGPARQRGAALLRMGHLANRRDILSGTPMPQGSTDLQSQLDFLWPGVGLGSRISRGENPRGVLTNLYVRTTKHQLELPPRDREEVLVTLTEAHLAFYSVLREDVRAQASLLYRGQSAIALINARKSVIRLLQAAVVPELVAQNLLSSTSDDKAGIYQAVIDEGPSERVRAAVKLVEQLAQEGKKVLVWTIFTSTIHQLKLALAHLQPALIYGEVNVGDEADEETRQGQLKKFKTDPTCKVMIANPAAASEGISLHSHCHDAVYVDRSYNATHYLQSIDRIHRLGLPPDTKTTIYVLKNKLPSGIGSIDASVSRRLAEKIRNLQRLLDDDDLHELALDEETAPMAIEDMIDAQDIDDLIAELENRAPPPTKADEASMWE